MCSVSIYPDYLISDMSIKDKKDFIKANYPKRVSNLASFKSKANWAHGGKYDYSEVEYHKAHDTVNIICPFHGSFTQKAKSHMEGSGCPRCSRTTSSKHTFIEKAMETHGDRYDYSDVQYIDNKTKVTIICPIHGAFHQRPVDHFRGSGCKECSNRYTTEVFIEKAIRIHSGYYLYDNVDYKDSIQHVAITCPVHGLFHQTPVEHLRGSGCGHCTKISRHYGRLKDKASYLNSGTIYVMRMHRGRETFIKVGITTKTAEERYRYFKEYDFRILYEVAVESLYDAYMIEQSILSTHKMFQVTPHHRFSGHTECLHISTEDSILETIKGLI